MRRGARGTWAVALAVTALAAAGCGAGTAAHVVAPATGVTTTTAAPGGTGSAGGGGATTTTAAPSSATAGTGVDGQSVAAINSELQTLDGLLNQSSQDLATGKEES